MHIEIRGVTKSFGRMHALRDFDLSVPPASVIALVGENGAGKSTLLRILAGISVPDEGLVTYDSVIFDRVFRGRCFIATFLLEDFWSRLTH